jgi:zinc-ribbon domain
MPTCANCGVELVEDARFCHRCGVPARAPRTAAGTPPARPAPPAPPSGPQEVCRVAWGHGVTKGYFYAAAAGADGREREIARSALFPWRREGPPPKEHAAAAAYEALARNLAASGWIPSGDASPWYAQSFTRPAQ